MEFIELVIKALPVWFAKTLAIVLAVAVVAGAAYIIFQLARLLRKSVDSTGGLEISAGDVIKNWVNFKFKKPKKEEEEATITQPVAEEKLKGPVISHKHKNVYVNYPFHWHKGEAALDYAYSDGIAVLLLYGDWDMSEHLEGMDLLRDLINTTPAKTLIMNLSHIPLILSSMFGLIFNPTPEGEEFGKRMIVLYGKQHMDAVKSYLGIVRSELMEHITLYNSGTNIILIPEKEERVETNDAATPKE